jgi:hypothetical protein
MLSERERIVQLAKDIQDDNRYGFINVGSDRYPNRTPVSPFIILGLLMAVEVLDGRR